MKFPIGPQLAHLLQLACWNPKVPALKSSMGPAASSFSAAGILGSKGPGLRVSYRARSWFTHPAFKSSIAPTAGSLAAASILGSKGPSLQVFNRSTAGSLTAASILGSKSPACKSSMGPTTGLPTAASIWGLWVPSLYRVQSHLHSATKHRSSIAVHAATLQAIMLSNEGRRQRPKLENIMTTQASASKSFNILKKH